jgi:glutathione S-transferase
MRLYYFPVAPNPTRVRVYLAEKGLAVEQVRVNVVEGEQRGPAHLARNPLGGLPVLELDDGRCLTESLAIIELLEELHPEPPMIGRDPFERARVREVERIAEINVLLPIARLIHATRSPLGLPPSPTVAASARAALPRGLAVLDERIGDQPFVAGAAPTIADCTLFAALQFARFGEVEIDPGYRSLARWWASFAARPSARLPG